MKCEEQFISELFFLILILSYLYGLPTASSGNVWGSQSQISLKSSFSSSSLDNFLQLQVSWIIIIQAATWRQNVWNSRHSISYTHSLLPCPTAIYYFLVCTYTAVYKCWPDRHVVSCASLYYQVPIAIHFLNFIMVLHCEDDIWWHQLRYRSFVVYV